MRLFKRLLAILAVVLIVLAVFGEFSVGQPKMRDLRQQVVVKSLDEYNALQLDRAMNTPMLVEHQVGDTCVFYQARSAQRALGKAEIDRNSYIEATGKLENVYFYDGLEQAGLEPGDYVGGLLGVIFNFIKLASVNGWHLFNDENAFGMIESSVDNGKVVIVSLDSGPLHKMRAQKLGKVMLSSGGPHAVRVLGFHRTSSKSIDQVYLYDSAAPGSSLRYAVPYDTFKASYSSWRFLNRMNRGVFVTEKSVFAGIDKRY